MLPLFRKVGDSIVIVPPDADEPIVAIQILSVSDGEVELGITAPDWLKILRGELWRRIRRGLDVLKPAPGRPVQPKFHAA